MQTQQREREEEWFGVIGICISSSVKAFQDYEEGHSH